MRHLVVALLLAAAGCTDLIELDAGLPDVPCQPACDVPTRCVAAECVMPPLTDVATSLHATCIVVDGASVWCWGGNESFELGVGDMLPRAAPVQAEGIPAPIHALHRGVFSFCAVAGPARDLYCWGNVSWNRANVGANQYETPRRVEAVTDVTDVAIGQRHICAVLGGEELRCAGINAQGQLGQPLEQELVDWEPVALPRPVRSVSTTTSVNMAHTTCVVAGAPAQVLCFGGNRWLQLGLDASVEVNPVPNVVPLPAEPVRVAVGQQHVCAVTVDDRVFCWGYGRDLMTGGPQQSVVPVPIELPPPVRVDVRHLEAVMLHNLLVSEQPPAVYGWGSGVQGVLGVSWDRVEPVVVFRSEDPIVALSSLEHTCLITGDAERTTLFCTGANGDGQLGTRDLGARTELTAVDPFSRR